MTEKPLAFLSLIKALEAAVGHRTKYAQLEPFPCTTLQNGEPDVIEIQKAARTIAQHAGLTDLTFIISATRQAPSTAGHIELRYGAPEVFIEISLDICPFKDAVLSTLCHEVSHKFLHVNGIRHGTVQVEQEFLTDVTSVFLGMGKIMLNGCECRRSSSRTENGHTTTTTQTVKTGYISRECFAFVYRLVCDMRRIPRDQYLNGLSDAARQAVLTCETRYSDWFMPQLHKPEEMESFRNNLQEQLRVSQTKIAGYDFSVRVAQKVIEAAGARLRDSHKPLILAESKVAELSRHDDNPHLRYLTCIETRESVGDLIRASEIEIDESRPHWQQIDELSKLSGEEITDSEVIECPQDRTRLRVPAGRKTLLVTCSVCKYRFVVRTATLDRAVTSSTSEPGAARRLLKSLKAAFGRR